MKKDGIDAELRAGARGSIHSDVPSQLRRQGVWISWERQRRTLELSARLGVRLRLLLHDGPRWRRYLVLTPRTVLELWNHRSGVVFVQNPSIVLAAIAGLLRPVLGYRLVVDRHSNFMLRKGPSHKKSLFMALSDWTCRAADLTIVTNSHLAGVVRDAGGRAFVLQDPLPDTVASSGSGVPRTPDRTEGRAGMFVCTFAGDEPYEEVIEAMARMPHEYTLFITGRRPSQGFPAEVQKLIDGHPGIRLTGFIPDDEYFELMRSSSFVMVLTRANHCLVCGAYEAIACDRPLVLSDRSALREYFGSEVPIYVDDGVESLETGLRQVFEGNVSPLEDRAKLRRRLSIEWSGRFRELIGKVALWLA